MVLRRSGKPRSGCFFFFSLEEVFPAGSLMDANKSLGRRGYIAYTWAERVRGERETETETDVETDRDGQRERERVHRKAIQRL